MASSSQRVSEPSAPLWKYDVFLSFRGTDVRNTFLSHLSHELAARSILAFKDDKNLEKGAPISPSLLKAIEESRFAIIVLSPNYASSQWCLEELTKIVDCMKDGNRILPLFYHVEPSDVRYQKKSYVEAFTDHEKKLRHEIEKLKRWRDALKTVSNFSGWDTQNKTERELVEDIAEIVCNKVGRQVAEITKNLQTEVDKLRIAKDTVNEKVNAAYTKGEKIHANVQVWLKKVDDITKEAQEFLKDEFQPTEESHDSMNHRSKKSLELLQVVTQLYETREFSDISYVVQAKDYCLESGQDYQEFDSRASTVEKIMDELRSPNCDDIILVHGIGGVGKTTLAEEVLRQAEKQKLFADLVMVRDVKKPNLEAIQQVIADKLGLNLSETQTTAGRADKICDRIKGKKTGDESKQDNKTLVIIDDVWEEIDFKAVGLPRTSTCRILLTSRTSKLLSADQRYQKPFQLGALGEEETRLLFEQRAGNVVEGGRIRTIATQLAKKCGGLPVLIVTVASRLRNETSLSAWEDALRILEVFDKEEKLTEKAYLGIEWSYAQLNENLKPLFLLCGTIVEGNSISLTNLLKYGMGLGIFKKTKNVKQARNLLYTRVRDLKDYSLLLDGDDDTCVRMHDLVHHVVNQIASRDHHVLVQDGVDDELKEWTEEDLFRCSKISLPCCNIATLPEVTWKCPKLEMFHLHSEDDDEDDDSSRDMPSNFFEEMKKLKVLGLNNLPRISLPPSLKCLENLQTLCLDGCKFEDIALVGELRNLQILSIVESEVKQLPKEIGQLTRLRLLDLCDCDRLEVISPGVISNLTSLEELRMRNSFDKWQGTKGVFGEISSNNASLSELTKLSKLTALEIRIPDANILPPNLLSNNLERYQIIVGDDWDPTTYQGDRWNWHRMYETTINILKLMPTASNELGGGFKMLLEKCDVLCLDGTKGFDFANIINTTNTKEVMFNLTTLSVYNCDGLKCLLSSSMARNLKKLKHLEISDCKIMEQIISSREHDEEDYMFGDLKSLKLNSLPNLARFCTGKCIQFPLLEALSIGDCTKLGAFVGRPLTKSNRKLEAREGDSEENLDVHSDGTSKRYFLFDEKVRFPGYDTSTTQLKDGQTEISLHIVRCQSLKSIFRSSMMGRLNGLQGSLHIVECDSLEAVFDECGFTDVKETHGTSTTQLKDGQTEISLHVVRCQSLKSIFRSSVMGRLNGLQGSLHIVECDSLEAVFDKCGFTNVKETHGTSTTQLKDCQTEISLHVVRCRSLKSIFRSSMMGRLNGLQGSLHIVECDSLEAVFDECGFTDVKETHGTSTTQLKDGQTEISLHIVRCRSLKSIFRSCMMGILNGLQCSWHLVECGSLEAVFDKCGFTDGKETHDSHPLS